MKSSHLGLLHSPLALHAGDQGLKTEISNEMRAAVDGSTTNWNRSILDTPNWFQKKETRPSPFSLSLIKKKSSCALEDKERDKNHFLRTLNVWV